MHALGIIGITVTSSLLGGAAGMGLGLHEGGDFNFAPAIYAPIGALIGGFVGLVSSVLVLA